ncbi:MAG: hypothetical protein ACI9MR_003091 [Myxococcota bacterium]|jgi:hypothetical protein
MDLWINGGAHTMGGGTRMQNRATFAAVLGLATGLWVTACTPASDRQAVDSAIDSTVDTSVTTGSLGFGFPCNVDSDCAVKACEPHLQQTLCSRACDEKVACPEGWTCGDGGVCVSTFRSLCRPCAADSDCGAAPGTACIDYSVGSFCGVDCDNDVECPDGYSCRAERTFTGETRTSCVRDAGICPCTASIEASGAPTICKNQNVYGVCLGERTCKDGQWTECGAVEPAPDYPNGVDDDCDGELDEISCLCGDGVCDIGCEETLDTCPCDCSVEGDGICSPCGENPITAPVDCCKGPFGTSGCGDGFCIGFTCGENPDTCGDDCGTPCGDGICQAGENPFNCEQDCLLKVCGNGICEGPDGGPEECPQDCAPFCGNCECESEHGEVVFNCPIDCGYCGDGICAICDALNEDPVTCPEDCCDERVESCNNLDDNCDNRVDEEGALGCQLRYIDGDGDGLGVSGSGRCLCEADATHVSIIPGDCDDGNNTVGLGVTEVCDGIDNDCDGAIDEPFGVGEPCDTGVDCQVGVTVCDGLTASRCGAGTEAPPGTVCQSQRCNGAGIQQQRLCSSNGLCNSGLVTGCNGYRCADDGAGPYCTNSCQQDDDCDIGSICDDNQRCVTPLAMGDPCSRTAQCIDGFFCSDGVCCDQGCDSGCETCVKPNSVGTCVPSVANLDPEDHCPLCQVCDGQGACKDAVVGTDPKNQCNASGCANGQLLGDACQGPVCGSDVLSNCVDNFGCLDNLTCRTECTQDNHCVTDHFCVVDDLGSHCEHRLPPGDPCTSDRMCLGDICVDGLCCTTACDEVCAVCGGDGICITAAADPACPAPDFCTAIGVCADGSGAITCTDSFECAPSTCEFPLGGGDGVCCDDAGCDGDCEVCNDPHVFGECALILADESATCSGTRWCDGTANCRDKIGSPCSVDFECPDDFFCGAGGLCEVGIAVGQPCSSDSRCVSGQCARNGVCCGTQCDDRCSTCDATGLCGAAPPGSVDELCPTGQVCSGYDRCGAKPGGFCDAALECVSGTCLDNSCCDAGCGDCETCVNSGSTCQASPEGGTTMRCNGPDVCHLSAGGEAVCLLADGQSCIASTDCRSEVCEDLIPGVKVCCAAECGGDAWCAGAATTGYQPGKCRVVDGNACVFGACPGGFVCDDGNVCRRLGGVGEGCDLTSLRCENGLTCVDNVCCDTPCSGQCESCNQSSFLGQCRELAGGEDDTCDGDFSCYPGGQCQRDNGAPCGNPEQCGAANFCTDGRCCTVETCGECSICGESGGCQEQLRTADASCTTSGFRCADGDCIASDVGEAGSYCEAGIECFSGHCYDNTCCDADCSGECLECSTGLCMKVTDGTEDPMTCDGPDERCMTGVCSTGVGTASQGDPCNPGPGLDCEALLECVDGVCCESLCDQECEQCNALGNCEPITDGTADPDYCPGSVCMTGACQFGCLTDVECGAEAYCDMTSGACEPLGLSGDFCTRPGQCFGRSCVDRQCP